MTKEIETILMWLSNDSLDIYETVLFWQLVPNPLSGSTKYVIFNTSNNSSCSLSFLLKPKLYGIFLSEVKVLYDIEVL